MRKENMKKSKLESQADFLLVRNEQAAAPEEQAAAPEEQAAAPEEQAGDGKGIKTFATKWSEDIERQEIFIPVFGYVWLYPEEIKIIDHPAFQRLSKIYQLGQTHLVYRGGTHKRFEHALGTLSVVQQMIKAITYTYKRSKKISKKSETSGMYAIPRYATAPHLSENEIRFVRLGALLHDIGHVAAGHTLEDELNIIGKHDHDSRINMVFNNIKDSGCVSLSEVIDFEFDKYIPKSLRAAKVTPSEITRLLIRKHPEDIIKKYNSESARSIEDEFKSQLELLKNCDDFRLSVLRDMIGNTICADLLDYLHRDWYHIGKPKTFDERILHYMEIRSSDEKTDKPSKDDVLVISLGTSPRIRTDAVSAILDLLETRYQLAESVLFHRTKVSASAMLDRALYELWSKKFENEQGQKEIEEFILKLSDEELISECLDQATNNDVAKYILTKLNERKIYEPIFTVGFDDLKPQKQRFARSIYAKSGYKTIEAAKNRVQAMRCLEEDFLLPRGSLIMCCHGEDMNAKIAEVRIALDGEKEKFCEYEEKNSNIFSGGHLKAQLLRFKRLWKAYLFIDPLALEVYPEEKRDPIKHLLGEAFLRLVLKDLKDGETSEAAARHIAMALDEILDGESDIAVDIAAYQNEMNHFPSEACRINLFKKKNAKK